MATKVRDGIVLTKKRQALINAYYARRPVWPITPGWWSDISPRCIGYNWTVQERTKFRKWRSGFMRPMK